MNKPSIADIKNEFIKVKDRDYRSFVSLYSDDKRQGVIDLIKRCERLENELNLEKVRLQQMLEYEYKYDSTIMVAGIDEAGRGPLAGPVVAAAVILDRNDPILYVNDSKQVSEEKREILFDEIINRSIAYGIGIVHEQEIDEINILQATYKAMRIAILQLKVTPDQLLNDAVIIPGVTMPQEKIIKGDTKSLSIAAASILAKVSRDRIMVAYDELYPEYGFKQHKGYGCPSHIQAIKTLGISPIHRKTFVKNFI